VASVITARFKLKCETFLLGLKLFFAIIITYTIANEIYMLLITVRCTDLVGLCPAFLEILPASLPPSLSLA
jgi:hypothetical protein